MAVNSLQRNAVDVIVLDVEMPVMDGLTAIPKLLAVSPSVKIIMASTLTIRNADISMRAMEAGRVSGPDGASVRALEEAGRVYAVYVHHGRVVRDAKPRYQTDQTAAVREIGIDLPAGKYAAVWRDTRTGREAKVERFTVQAGGEKKMLTSPVYADDIGLIVRAE